MTALDALSRCSHEALSRFHALDASIPDVHLRLCPDCEQSLLRELASLLQPIMGRHAQCLQGSHVMGCTFSAGTTAECALHTLLYEDATLCP